MNRYGVTVNNHPEKIVLASAARTAVDRAMMRFIEGEFKPFATIKVRFIEKVAATWDVVADVPFDYGENGKGYSKTVLEKALPSQDEAMTAARRIQQDHPDYKMVHTVKRTH